MIWRKYQGNFFENYLNQCMKTEPVTVGADATVYTLGFLMGQIDIFSQKPDIFSSIFSSSERIHFLSGDSDYFCNSVVESDYFCNSVVESGLGIRSFALLILSLFTGVNCSCWSLLKELIALVALFLRASERFTPCCSVLKSN